MTRIREEEELNLSIRRQMFLQQCTSWSGYHSNPQVRVIPQLMLSYEQKS